MKLEISERKARGERDIKITKADTIARWMLWSKVAVDGVVMKTHEQALAVYTKASEKDKLLLQELATNLAKASHDRTVARRAGEVPVNSMPYKRMY